jgi:hypothetical protein
MMERPADPSRFKGKRALVLWASWLLGPAAWALHQNASYILVPWVCGTGNTWALHLATVVALAVAGGGGLLAWRSRRRAVPAAARDRAVQRSRFLAVCGLLLCGLSFMGILVEAIPNFVMDACQGLS